MLELLSAGASRAGAARGAGVHPSQLSRWIAKGRASYPGSTWRRFAEDVQAAESDPRVVALQAAHERMLDNPLQAWRFLLERGEFDVPGPEWPRVIRLTLPKAAPRGGDVISAEDEAER